MSLKSERAKEIRDGLREQIEYLDGYILNMLCSSARAHALEEITDRLMRKERQIAILDKFIAETRKQERQKDDEV